MQGLGFNSNNKSFPEKPAPLRALIPSGLSGKATCVLVQHTWLDVRGFTDICSQFYNNFNHI